MSLVLFDQGHTGKTGGKVGATWLDLREDLLVSTYTAHAVHKLRSIGHDAAYSGPGPYKVRQARSKTYGASIYLACHVNSGASALRDAGNARRHTIFYDYHASDRGGKGLASSIANACAQAFPTEAENWRIRECKPNHWTSNAHFLIAETGNASAVTLEPGFIDEPEHQHLWTDWGLERLGVAIAAGVQAHLNR
jgi:N-acetylmuramoyl-L-alanine amidase